jgi:hypothetical protein
MKILITALVLFLSFTVQANALVFDCSVKDFVNLSGFDKDDFFVQSNLKKRFIISVDEDEIISTSVSETYTSSVIRHKIFSRYEETVKAIEMNDTFSYFPTIVLNEITGEATISNQTTISLSAWLLDCKKQ